jgi:hypothetical protein
LHLVDGDSGKAAILTIAADNGTLLTAEGFGNRGRARQEPPIESGRPVAGSEERRAPANGRSPNRGLPQVVDKVGNFFERVGRRFDRRGRQIGDKFHNFFTGDDRDSVGPRVPRDQPETAPPPPRTYRDRNGTDYYRPRD